VGNATEIPAKRDDSCSSGRYFSDNNDLIAERKGFEPLAPLSSAAAYQAALSHSATSGQVLA
jgi:hypothetical protein